MKRPPRWETPAGRALIDGAKKSVFELGRLSRWTKERTLAEALSLVYRLVVQMDSWDKEDRRPEMLARAAKARASTDAVKLRASYKALAHRLAGEVVERNASLKGHPSNLARRVKPMMARCGIVLSEETIRVYLKEPVEAKEEAASKV
ncbi:hypothetical protein SAMN05444161_3104 [Rhizobiales bacterium GAS191]|nr:hypothetical protein SAMN05444161_3104 [Rhizobiales bacterium GAS191]